MISNFYQRNSSDHTSSNETMDISPRYTANTNHHGDPVEHLIPSSPSMFNAYGGPSFSPQDDMHTPPRSRYMPATAIANGK